MRQRLERSRAVRWLIGLSVLVMVPLTSFQAYALHSRLTPTRYVRGGEFLTGLPTAVPSSAAPSPSAAARTRRATSSAAPSPSAAASPVTVHDSSRPSPTEAPSVEASTTARSPHAGPRPTVSPSRAAVSPSDAAAGPVLPRTGLYELAVTGSEKASFGPIGLCSPDLPAKAELAVSKADGETATSYDFDLRLYPGDPSQHDERHLVRYTPQGVFTDFEQAVVTCLGIKQATVLPYTPPQLSVAPVLTVGSTWHNHGGGPDRTEDATSTVTGTDTISVGGVAYPVVVIHTTVAMTGHESGSRERTWWWSSQLGVPLRFAEHISADKDGGDYSNTYTATVTSLPPS